MGDVGWIRDHLNLYFVKYKSYAYHRVDTYKLHASRRFNRSIVLIHPKFL